MTREETKNPLPMMQAWEEGKTIQDWTNDTWKDKEYTSFGELSQSPIKSETKYARIEAQIAVLKDIAEEYPGKTIENIIVQLEARREELNKSK